MPHAVGSVESFHYHFGGDTEGLHALTCVPADADVHIACATATGVQQATSIAIATERSIVRFDIENCASRRLMG
jgi:hypothetical protein